MVYIMDKIVVDIIVNNGNNDKCIDLDVHGFNHGWINNGSYNS